MLIFFSASLVSTPGAGLGFFTAVELQPNDVVGRGDVLIPLIDHRYHLQALGSAMMQRDDWDDVDPTADYVWNGNLLGMHRETAHPKGGEVEFVEDRLPLTHYTQLFVKGLQLTMAFHSYIPFNRVRSGYGRGDQLSYGAGKCGKALSPLRLCRSPSQPRPWYGSVYPLSRLRNVRNGNGDTWWVTREKAFGEIPLFDDYLEAEQLVQSLSIILQQHNVTDTAARRDLWELANNLPWTKSRTLKALPSSYDLFEVVAQHGIRAVHQPQATRSIQELQRTGRCADSIRSQPSTIRQAGRGAFTTRAFQSGSIVAGYAPTLLSDGRHVENVCW